MLSTRRIINFTALTKLQQQMERRLNPSIASTRLAGKHGGFHRNLTKFSQDAQGKPMINWDDGWEEIPESADAAIAKSKSRVGNNNISRWIEMKFFLPVFLAIFAAAAAIFDP